MASCSHHARSAAVLSIFQFLILGAYPEPKVTKRVDDLLSIQIYRPTKFQPDRANDVQDMRYQIFSLFGIVF